MPKLTEQQKYENSLKRKIKSIISKNKKERFPRPFHILAHNFWEDFPKFRDIFNEKEDDKIRLTALFEYISNQNLL